jgi:hypothetical protein
MKKTNLLLLSLCAILVAAPRGGGGSRRLGPEAATGIAFLLPPAVELSDLDVRDAQNNRIISLVSHEQLTELFRENLVTLMVFAPPHAMAATMSWIESISHLFNKSLLNKLSVIFEPLQALILPPSRRFVHNVDNLWVTFSVGLFGGCLLLSALYLPRSPLRVHLRL